MNKYRYQYLFLLFIIFLIIMVIYPLNAFSQDNSKMNNGEFWLSLDSAEKIIFFIGVREGIRYAILDILADNSASGLSDISLTKQTQFIYYILQKYNCLQDVKIITDIITNLYKSPENSFIKFAEIIEIAVKKLKGESIEKLLELRRKEAF